MHGIEVCMNHTTAMRVAEERKVDDRGVRADAV
jgi:hypothetical protein